ncbi:MAG: tRNA (adenosine(37)-N6)-threonylcarbamoyltransferase complex dimerization subunit type 1 TsaB [Actinobacteria bacterium]|nr:tRNA (adenosine(37)-N6)-threonylcarbamoyltransferase complex dimerization subunit type 1 TsaB [Actinomycetota bacterium]
MNCLVIDSATDRSSLALFSGNDLLYSGFHDGATEHAEALPKLLAECLRVENRVDQVVVGMGPGPYTGLRVGIIFAQSFACARQISWIGVCSLDGIDIDSHSYIVSTDARRKEIYWARYQDGLRVEGPKVSSPIEIKDIEIMRFGHGFTDALYPSMALLLAKSKSQDIRQPFYLRRPDATESSAR